MYLNAITCISYRSNKLYIFCWIVRHNEKLKKTCTHICTYIVRTTVCMHACTYTCKYILAFMYCCYIHIYTYMHTVWIFNWDKPERAPHRQLVGATVVGSSCI